MANPLPLTPSKLAKIPPSVLNTYPGLQPPAGVKSNFINPEDRGYILNSVATLLFCLMVLLFANRVYTKLFIIRKADWDDCKCPSKHVEQTQTTLTVVQSNKHNRICRYSTAFSTYSTIDIVTVSFNCNVHRHSLE